MTFLSIWHVIDPDLSHDKLRFLHCMLRVSTIMRVFREKRSHTTIKIIQLNPHFCVRFPKHVCNLRLLQNVHAATVTNVTAYVMREEPIRNDVCRWYIMKFYSVLYMLLMVA
jgi:hypothetical protein